MIILRNKLYSSWKDDVDDVSKKYALGSIGFLGSGGYFLGTSRKKSFKKKLKKILDDNYVDRDKILKDIAQKYHRREISDQDARRMANDMLDREDALKKIIKKAKSKINRKQMAGRGLTSVGIGLGTAAGYRYYKNRQEKDNLTN